MSNSNEADFKGEIDKISKTIDSILNKIESERAKLLGSDQSETPVPVNAPEENTIQPGAEVKPEIIIISDTDMPA